MSTTSVTKKPNIAEISPHLICALCGGYLIDATTIVECLHSFCKTCIVRYLESSKYCPICEVLVHKTRPLQNIRLDHTLQDIVYKLVPELFKDEMRRRREFYKDSPTVRTPQSKLVPQRERIIYSADEKFSVALEFCPEGKIRSRLPKRSKIIKHEAPERRYLLCPAGTNIALLKRFIRMKFAIPDNFKVEVFHSEGNLRDHYSLIDVAYIYSWKREGVLQLNYTMYKEKPPKTPRIEITEVKEENKFEVLPKLEDHRPSSLFSSTTLLGNRCVDGDIPHNLSPLELIATVANDLCLQEGRGLKRKADESVALYENEDETSNSSEIQIQKSIEHAIDMCSSNNGNSSNSNYNISTNNSNHSNTIELPSNKAIVNPLPGCKTDDISNITEKTKYVTQTSVSSDSAVTVFKGTPKEKPKTTETASQCDSKRDSKLKKQKTDANSAHSQHSRSQTKQTNIVSKDIDVKREKGNCEQKMNECASQQNNTETVIQNHKESNNHSKQSVPDVPLKSEIENKVEAIKPKLKSIKENTGQKLGKDSAGDRLGKECNAQTDGKSIVNNKIDKSKQKTDIHPHTKSEKTKSNGNNNTIEHNSSVAILPETTTQLPQKIHKENSDAKLPNETVKEKSLSNPKTAIRNKPTDTVHGCDSGDCLPKLNGYPSTEVNGKDNKVGDVQPSEKV